MRKQHTVIGGGGLQLNVMESGRADGPVIFMIHGWSQSYMTWIKQIESKLSDEFRLVAMDLRGHGMSQAPLEQAAYTDAQLWADDVHAVIEALELKRPTLVGWSYGGFVMTDYVRAYGDDNIAGINFVCAAVKIGESALGTVIGPGFYEHFEDATSSDLERSIDGIRRFVERCFKVKLSRQEYERILCWNMTARPDVRASLAAREIDASDVLQSLKVPALITQGRDDITVLPSMAEFIDEHCETGTLSWYDGVAHGPFIEDPERFNDELAVFVRAANASRA